MFQIHLSQSLSLSYGSLGKITTIEGFLYEHLCSDAVATLCFGEFPSVFHQNGGTAQLVETFMKKGGKNPTAAATSGFLGEVVTTSDRQNKDIQEIRIF